MPHIYGPAHWHEDVQSCSKHGIPTLPCPQCLAEQDPAIQVMLDESDRTVLDCEPDVMMPLGHPWLIERLV